MIDLLKGLNVPKSIMGFGGFIVLAAVVNESFFGITIVDGTNVFAAVIGVTIFLVGVLSWNRKQELDAQLKIADAELREEKLRAGLDPTLDKTVIRSSND